MQTTVYLIRNAETAWNVERRLAGRRELGLSETGQATAQSLVERFGGIALDELLASPLPRTVETAQPLAAAQGLQVARDPRLIDWQPGAWEGMTYGELMADPRYAQLLSAGLSEGALPGGERFADILTRMAGSVRQALEDNELGARIGVVSHAGPLRLLLSHYLAVPPLEHERLRMEPGAVTVLGFSALDAPPTLIAMNQRGRVP